MNELERYNLICSTLKSKGIVKSNKEIATKLGYTNQTSFSQILCGAVDIPKSFASKFIVTFPQLNKQFVMFGTGSILNDEDIVVSKDTNMESEEYVKIITDFQTALSKSQQQIDRLLSIIENMQKQN